MDHHCRICESGLPLDFARVCVRCFDVAGFVRIRPEIINTSEFLRIRPRFTRGRTENIHVAIVIKSPSHNFGLRFRPLP